MPFLSIRSRTGVSRDILAEDYKSKQSNPLYSTCMDVIIRANKEDCKKEGIGMCEALREWMYELYGEEIKKVQEETEEKASLTTIINLICKKIKRDKSVNQIASDLEVDEKFVSQICLITERFSLDSSSDAIYMKWKELFAA